MAKVDIQNITNLSNEPRAVGKINANFESIQDVIETLLSRDGALPNTMQAFLDMNSERILNLPVPVSAQEPARHGDIQQYVDRAEDAAESAEEDAASAEEDANRAEQYLADLNARYVGSYGSAPTENPDGTDLSEGALYFDTGDDIFYVWTVEGVAGVDEVVTSSWEPIPVNAILSMSDIVHTWSNKQLPQWNTGQSRFIAFDLNADNVPYDKTVKSQLSSETTQDAIDEILERTTLNVYDMAFYLEGLLVESARLFRLIFPRKVVVPSDTTGFYATAKVAAAGDVTIPMSKNGTQFGTISWGTGDTEGTWSIPGDTTFNAGDVFEMDASDVVDTALRDLSITIIARRLV